MQRSEVLIRENQPKKLTYFLVKEPPTTLWQNFHPVSPTRHIVIYLMKSPESPKFLNVKKHLSSEKY
jgi:hypothetical protein